VVPLQVPPADRAVLSATLTPAERARADRYRFSADARRFSVARGWLRQVLGAELGIPAAEVTFAYDRRGKPRVAGAGGPCFNLSHAGELAVIAISDGDVGVDIEPETSAPAALEAAAIACTPAEAAALDRLPAEDRAQAALRLWTVKEAYLKATGEGLSVALDQVEIPAPWTVRELRPAPGYVGAVAAQGEAWEIVFRSTHLVSDRA
jgi:4'-phosphopantetheinyl transferase